MPVIKEVINDTGMVHVGGSNQEVRRQIMFALNRTVYRITIKVETYAFQSWARLERFSEGGVWTELSSMQPQRDFNIDNSVAYTEHHLPITEAYFDPIIRKLRLVAADFHDAQNNF